MNTAPKLQEVDWLLEMIDEFAYVAGQCGADNVLRGNSNARKAEFNLSRQSIEDGIRSLVSEPVSVSPLCDEIKRSLARNRPQTEIEYAWSSLLEKAAKAIAALAPPSGEGVVVPLEAVSQAAAALDVLGRRDLAAWLMRSITTPQSAPVQHGDKP